MGFDDFLRRKGREQAPDDDIKRGVKKILDRVVGDAYPSLTLQACAIVRNKKDVVGNLVPNQIPEEVLFEVMDRLHKAFYDLGDEMKKYKEPELTDKSSKRR